MGSIRKYEGLKGRRGRGTADYNLIGLSRNAHRFSYVVKRVTVIL